MAVDAYDPTTGHPIFLESGAPQDGADHTSVARHAGEVGNRLIGAGSERTAYGYARRGLAWFDTTRNRPYLHNLGEWTLPARGGALYGTTAQRVTATESSAPGDLFYDTDTQSLWRLTGGAWVKTGPDDTGWAAGTVAAGMSGSIRTRRIGKIAHVEGSITSGLGSTPGAIVTIGSVPAEFRPITQMVGSAYLSSSGAASGVSVIAASGNLLVVQNVGTRNAAAFTLTYPLD